jgi:hypothetical protein
MQCLVQRYDPGYRTEQRQKSASFMNQNKILYLKTTMTWIYHFVYY